MNNMIKLICTCALMLGSTAATAQMAAVATPPQGTVWNTMGSAIANVARSEAGVSVLVQPYGGNRAMLDAVDQQLAEFAINDVNDVIIAVAGEEAYSDRRRENLRLVMTLNPMPIGIFVRSDSGINTIEDLRGKRVASDWNAFPLGRSHMEAMLATGGLTWDDVQRVPVPDLIRGADALAAGRLDATFFAVGGPKVAEVDASVGGVKFIPVNTDDEAVAAMQRVRPAFYLTEVSPAAHIAGITETIPMVTWDNVIVAGSHVSDDLVFKMVGAILDNVSQLASAYPGFAALSAERASQMYEGLEKHNGAIRYFQEHGQ